MFDTATPIDTLDRLQRWLAPYPWAYDGLVVAGLALLAWLANWVTKRILVRGLQKLLARIAGATGNDPDVKLRVVPRLANVVPALVLQNGIGAAPHLPPLVVAGVEHLCQAFIALTVALAVSHVLDVFNHSYERRAEARHQPIKGYLQVAKIIVFVLAGLAVIATLSGIRVEKIVTGLGAMTAVLILVFQDTLLSLVASVQISNDGRVRLGDWIEMPTQNADGTVTDIALHTLTVQNWDMTVSTIPTKKLISESFKNWRGMYESGGRRIKRSLYLDQHSVGFLAGEDIQRLRQLQVLGGYLDDKQRELRDWNHDLAQRGVDPLNERRLTNLGTFRAYVELYLRADPRVNTDMLLLVRQLQPGSAGLPLEVYCFCNDVRLTAYEQVQADIFDHLLAVLPVFGLRVFQESSDAMLMAGPRNVSGPP